MREIKFRAWVPNRKELFSSDEIYDGDLSEFFAKFDDLNREEKEYGHDPLILMQYTSLKDKNGKEIYEGDILELNSGGIPFAVSWSDRYGCWDWRGDALGACLISDWGFEIIGNIYENSDLLK